MRFEQRRRDLLPVAHGSDSRTCDEIIGRFCFWDDDDDAADPPPESDELVRSRAALVDDLTAAAKQLPGDEWIAGQRVRYLVESRNAAGAASAASECRPREGWWCLALLGFARHAAEKYAEAEAAFDSALRAMPEKERCRWDDISHFLEGRESRSYRRLPCDARDSLESRFWSLGDAMLLIPGNERRSEHFARAVQARLQEDAFPLFGVPWGDDLREVVLRYGWPVAWFRKEDRLWTPAGTYDISLQFARGRSFDPASDVLNDPSRQSTDDALTRRRPRARYAPSYAAVFDSLPHQIAVFRRGDSIALIGAYDVSGDSVPASTPARAGLFLSRERKKVEGTVQERALSKGVVLLIASPAAGFVSLEVLVPEKRRAGRARYWLPLTTLPAQETAISDLLLLSHPDSLPHTLEEAIPLARTGMSVRYGETLGLYWEVYGLGPGSVPVSLKLTLVKEGKSLIGRAAGVLGLGSHARPAVSLEWSEMSQAVGPTSGTIAVDLAKNGPGRYTLRLDVTSEGRGSVAQREITINR